MAKAQARIAESRRLAALSDVVRPERLDLAMLLALAAAKEGDTLEARGSLQRALDTRPEVVRFLHVPEGDVASVAFGPEGQIAAGYSAAASAKRGGVVLFDARGERLRPAPLEVKEGDVRSVAFGPEGQIAAGYRAARGGVVLFDARGERLRPAPLEVKEGDVKSVAFGPEGQIAAGYGAASAAAAWCSSTPGASGSDPRRWRSRRAMSGAWPSGRRARSPRDIGVGDLGVRRRGALRRPGRAAPTRAAGGQGGPCHERGLRAGGPDRRGIWRPRRPRSGVVLFDARGERLRPTPLEVKEGGVTSVAFGPEGQIAAGYGVVAAASAAWCSSTPGASGSDPRRWRSRRARSGAWPSGRRARSPRDMAAAAPRRRGALRRPGRAAPTRPLEVKEGGVTSVAFGPEGQIAAGYCGRRSGVVLFDARGKQPPPQPLQIKKSKCQIAWPSGRRARSPRDLSVSARHIARGVVLFDADPASWLRKAGQTASRNFTRLEWTRYFPETSYRRTIRSLPWPHDLPEAERKQAEAFEKEHPEGSDAS